MHSQRGIGLIELLVALTIIGILLSMGFTSLRRDRFAVNQAAEGLARDFQLARFEAIKSNEFLGIEVEAATDRYRFLVDQDRDGALDDAAGDAVTKTVRLGSEQGVDVTTDLTFIFDPRGIALSLATGAVSLGNRSGDYIKTVCISAQGQAHIVLGTTCP